MRGPWVLPRTFLVRPQTETCQSSVCSVLSGSTDRSCNLVIKVGFEDTEMAVLQTANLLLSPCSPRDGADFIDLERDPEVMRFLYGGAVDHENTDPNKVTFLMPRGIEPYVWTARRKENGEFVGWFCLFPESEKLAEIGYRLR